MVECPWDHPALPPLFDPLVPNNPALWAVLSGRNAGKALVDDHRNPTQCLLRTDAVLTFASTRMTQTFLREGVARLRRSGPVWLIWPSEISLQPVAQDAIVGVSRLEFYDCDPSSTTLVELRQRLPEGFVIRAIDRQLLERCVWRSEMEFYCGSLDNFLANGVGLCLMRGDAIISEAYASALGRSHAEIGAVTHERYRGRGHAPVACAYLIKHLDLLGYQVYWSCDSDHVASIRVARKLGFRQAGAYQILGYPPLD